MKNSCSKTGTKQTTTVYGYIKFGEEKWLKRLFYGELSFSCAANFISYAQCTGDKKRGDPYEAIFARLWKNDTRIEEYKYKLEKDLEIIEDGNHVLLRRRSACLVPIFCIFGIPDSSEYFEKKEEDDNIVKLKFKFSEEMYQGFSDNSENASVFFQAAPFDKAIEETFNSLTIPKINRLVNYTYRANNEFVIEPNDNYDELFYKRDRYKVQNEYRIILPKIKFTSPCERRSVCVPNIDMTDKYLFHQRVAMIITCKKAKNVTKK